jgi:hypothetical protein
LGNELDQVTRVISQAVLGADYEQTHFLLFENDAKNLVSI